VPRQKKHSANLSSPRIVRKKYIIVSSSFRPHIVYSPTGAVPSFNPRLTTISLTKAYE